MSGPRDNFAYHSDDGKTYALRQNRCNLQALGIPTCLQADCGLLPPGDLRPRYVVARHPNGRITRHVIVDDISQPVWTGEARTLHLPLYNSPAEPLVPFRITLRVAERVTGTRTTYRKRKLPRLG